MDDRIGEELLAAGVITPSQLASARQMQKSIGGDLGAILVKLRYVTEETLLQHAAQAEGLRRVRLEDINLSAELLLTFEPQYLEKHEVLPIERKGDTLVLAMADPQDVGVVDDIRFMTGLNVDPVMMSRREIQKGLNEYFHRSTGESGRLGRVSVDKVQLAREIRSEGLHARSSDELDQGGDAALTAEGVRLEDLGVVGVTSEQALEALLTLLIEREVITLDELQQRLS